MSLTGMFHLQRSLSEAQAIPVFGPIIVSPVKAVVSLAQMIMGLASFILLGSATLVFQKKCLLDKSITALGQVGLGLIGITYSLSNIITLGYAGYFFESLKTSHQTTVIISNS
jgi:hypothetical protein